MSDSHRQILRSTSIIGGASVINILVGLLRTKAAAVILGPVGLGVIGLFQSLMATVSTLSAMGFGNVGTRQIAEAAGSGDVVAIETARRALYWGTLLLALIGAGACWTLRFVLAEHVLGDQSRAADVGWLAVGVALTVIAGSQSALLNGLRRVGDFARVSVLSGFLSAALGVGSLYIYGERGLLFFVLSGPLAAFVLGYVYVRRLPKQQVARISVPNMIAQWQMLLRLGFAFMAAGMAVTIGQLVVRSLVQQKLGAEALGNFQASWTISMTYVGFVLTAMGTDYYPRLTSVVRDHAAVNRLVNEQTEVALLLAGPVFLLMLALAPWVINLLYSHRFAEAADVLRWQILGDMLKVSSWPLGFILLASGDGRSYMLCDITTTMIFLLVVSIGLPYVGLQATGIGFFIMYVANLILVHRLARKRTNFSWTPSVYRLIVRLILVCAVISLMSYFNSFVAAGCGTLLSLLFAFKAMQRLQDSIPAVAVLNRKLQRCYARLTSIVR